MHGRLKVKTTAEQQEEKRKEREKKSSAFLQGMRYAFENRSNWEHKDAVLNTTEKLLSGNPDVYTLWNIRKEIFTEMKNTNCDIKSLLHKELKFIQNCLHVNPKSYGVWNHRRFVLFTMQEPDWHEELRLCNLFLKYDERNFHCWDYRRFVVSQAHVSAQDEFDFTTEKIIDNFSNYSAWHNRSKLLPILKPDTLHPEKVEETALLKEFELVQNAFFTDPNDQSAWFYQRWLLGRRDQKAKILSVVIKRQPLLIIASFSMKIEKPFDAGVSINGTAPTTVNWQSMEAKDGVSDCSVWFSELSGFADIATENIAVEISFPRVSTTLSLHLSDGNDSTRWCWATDRLPSSDDNRLLFCETHTEAKISVLENELEACKMLLDEEPNNKWTMLTIIHLMRALDGLRYEKETEELLSKLIVADRLRHGYYEDLRSKYRVENYLQRVLLEEKPVMDFDLSGKDLTYLPYGPYLCCCRVLNLNNNRLRDLSFCSQLVGLDKLILTNNNFESVDIQTLFPWKIDVVL